MGDSRRRKERGRERVLCLAFEQEEGMRKLMG